MKKTKTLGRLHIRKYFKKNKNVFCTNTTYSFGDKCLFNNIEYTFIPNEKQNQFSLGILPTEGQGWKVSSI